MPSDDTKILEFNQYQESYKASFVIFASLESFIEKIVGCKNNPENSSIIKKGEHILSGFSGSLISTILSCISIENIHDVYSGKDCIKKFSES